MDILAQGLISYVLSTIFIELQVLCVKYLQENKLSPTNLKVSLGYNLSPEYLLWICRKFYDLLNQNNLNVAPIAKYIKSTPSLFHTLEKSHFYDPLLPYYYLHSHILARITGKSDITPKQIKAVYGREICGKKFERKLQPNDLYPTHFERYTRILGHLSSVYCVAFDRTGQYIFTGADDHLVKVWAAWDGRLLYTLRGHSAEITDLAIDYENTLLAASSVNKIIRVWFFVPTFVPCAVLTGHTAMITMLQFSAYSLTDVRYLISSGNDGNICIWTYHCNTHQFDKIPLRFIERSRPGNQMLCTSISPGGMFLAAGGSDHFTRIYYFGSGTHPEKIDELETHSDRVDSIKFANTSLRFITGSRDGLACVWSLEQNNNQTKRWTPLILTMASTLSSTNNTQINPPPILKKEEKSTTAKLKVTMVAWNCNDTLIATAVTNFWIKIWDSFKGILLHELKGHTDDVFVLEAHPNNPSIMVSASHDGNLILWDIEKGYELTKIFNNIENQGHGAFFDCKWSPLGFLLASTDSHGQFTICGFGHNDAYKNSPREQFFHTDFRPVVQATETLNNAARLVDEQTHIEPHLMGPPFLVDVDGNPYPPAIQKRVPGRAHTNDQQLIPNVFSNQRGEMEILDVPNASPTENSRSTTSNANNEQNNSNTPIASTNSTCNETVDLLKRLRKDRIDIDEQTIKNLIEHKRYLSQLEIDAYEGPLTPHNTRHGRRFLGTHHNEIAKDFSIKSEHISKNYIIPNTHSIKHEHNGHKKHRLLQNVISSLEERYTSTATSKSKVHEQKGEIDQHASVIQIKSANIKRKTAKIRINSSTSPSAEEGGTTLSQHNTNLVDASKNGGIKNENMQEKDHNIDNNEEAMSDNNFSMTHSSDSDWEEGEGHSISNAVKTSEFNIQKISPQTNRSKRLVNEHTEKVSNKPYAEIKSSNSSSSNLSPSSNTNSTGTFNNQSPTSSSFSRTSSSRNGTASNFSSTTEESTGGPQSINIKTRRNSRYDSRRRETYENGRLHGSNELSNDHCKSYKKRRHRNNYQSDICSSHLRSSTIGTERNSDSNVKSSKYFTRRNNQIFTDNDYVESKVSTKSSRKNARLRINSSIEQNEQNNFTNDGSNKDHISLRQRTLNNNRYNINRLTSLRKHRHNVSNSGTSFNFRKRKLASIKHKNGKRLNYKSPKHRYGQNFEPKVNDIPHHNYSTRQMKHNTNERSIFSDLNKESQQVQGLKLFTNSTTLQTKKHVYYNNSPPEENSLDYSMNDINNYIDRETLYKIPDWMRTPFATRSPFIPQIGDTVVYIRHGHELYVEEVQKLALYSIEVNTLPYIKYPSLRSIEYARVLDISFQIKPPRLCHVTLRLMDHPSNTFEHDGANIGEGKKKTSSKLTDPIILEFTFHDVPDIVDFLVLKGIYHASLNAVQTCMIRTLENENAIQSAHSQPRMYHTRRTATVEDHHHNHQRHDVETVLAVKPNTRIRSYIDGSWWFGTLLSMDTASIYTPSPKNSKHGETKTGIMNFVKRETESNKMNTNDENLYYDAFLKCQVLWDKTSDIEHLSPWDFEIMTEDEEFKENDRKDSEKNKHGNDLYGLNYISLTFYTLYEPGFLENLPRLTCQFKKQMTVLEAEAFVLPVDTEAYPDYCQIVAHPIDLTLIHERMTNQYYRRSQALLFDLHLLLSNATLYNESDSEIVRDARYIYQLCCKTIGANNRSQNVECSSTFSSTINHMPSATSIPHNTTNSIGSGIKNISVYDTFSHLISIQDNMLEDDPIMNMQQCASTSNNQRLFRHSRRPHHEKPHEPPCISWQEECKKLVDTLWNNEDSLPFRAPVDVHEYPEYEIVIKHPIDLNTIRKNLHHGLYKSVRDFRQDIRLMFANSRAFNTNKRSRIYVMTLRLSALFEAQIKLILQTVDMMENSRWARRRVKANPNNDYTFDDEFYNTRKSGSYTHKFIGARKTGSNASKRLLSSGEDEPLNVVENKAIIGTTEHPTTLSQEQISSPSNPQRNDSPTSIYNNESHTNTENVEETTNTVRIFDEKFHRGKFKRLRSIVAENLNLTQSSSDVLYRDARLAEQNSGRHNTSNSLVNNRNAFNKSKPQLRPDLSSDDSTDSHTKNHNLTITEHDDPENDVPTSTQRSLRKRRQCTMLVNGPGESMPNYEEEDRRHLNERSPTFSHPHDLRRGPLKTNNARITNHPSTHSERRSARLVNKPSSILHNYYNDDDCYSDENDELNIPCCNTLTLTDNQSESESEERNAANPSGCDDKMIAQIIPANRKRCEKNERHAKNQSELSDDQMTNSQKTIEENVKTTDQSDNELFDINSSVSTNNNISPPISHSRRSNRNRHQILRQPSVPMNQQESACRRSMRKTTAKFKYDSDYEYECF